MMKVVDEVRKILEILLCIFVVLKLAGLVLWPWWQVLAPLWVPVVVVTVVFIVACAEVLARKIRRKMSS